MKTPNAPATTTRKTNQEKALAAFCQHTAAARELAARIARHLDDHMGVAPEEVNWAHAGDANRMREALKEIAVTFNLK